jgi:hypothetical protein
LQKTPLLATLLVIQSKNDYVKAPIIFADKKMLYANVNKKIKRERICPYFEGTF